jgi:hypothetical protein
VLAVQRAGTVSRRLGRHLDNDPVGADGGCLRRFGRTAGDHTERAPVEDVLGPQQQPERAVPAQRVVLVGQHAEPPRA